MMKFPKRKIFRDKEMVKRYGLDNPRCERCGAVAVDVHHIIFRSQGGSDMPINLISLCRSCHEMAHGTKSRAFRLELRIIKDMQ